MDSRQSRQEKAYRFPYHHIPSLEDGHFSQVRVLPWGYQYLSYLEAALDYIERHEPSSLLDIGCGDGKFLYEARGRLSKIKLFGNDYSKQAIDLAQALNIGNKISFSTKQAGAIAKAQGQFDIVTAIEVLEHIPPTDIKSFCLDFNSALKKEGFGLITVPSDNLLVNKKHYQHFNERTLTETLVPYFKVLKIYFLNELSWTSWTIEKILSNRFYILNYTPVVDTIYSYYKKHLLYTESHKCSRLMAVVEKRED